MEREARRAGRLGVRLIRLLALLGALPALLSVVFFVTAAERRWLLVAPAAAGPLALFAVVMALGGLLAAAVLWRYLQQRLITPLHELRDVADAFGHGEYGRRLAIRTDDELAEAAAQLNQLAERVTAVTGDLESRVAEGSRELGRAMGELHLLKKLNDAIIHNIPSGIGILAEDSRLLYLNASFDRLWRIGPQRPGRPLQECGAGSPLGEIDWVEALRPVLETGEPVRGVTVETGEWPRRRVVRYSLFPLPAAQLDVPLRLVGDEFCLGVISPSGCEQQCETCYASSQAWRGQHILLLIDDITEQHQMEAQLIQSEKLAALGQLAAGIAHEVRNPLSAIYGAAFYIDDVLTDDVPDLTDVEPYVKLIQRNVERAQRIVRDILNFARPSDADSALCDLADLVHQTLAILDKAMVDQAIELHRELEHGLVVQCRGETVKQALLNLIVNGMQAMPDGGQLTVTTTRENGQPVILVTDTGCGIPPGDLKRVFNPFFTTKPAGQGTGLGLSIARRAIENDHGRLEVQSEVGRGTTFRVYLPAAVTPASAGADQPLAETA